MKLTYVNSGDLAQSPHLSILLNRQRCCYIPQVMFIHVKKQFINDKY